MANKKSIADVMQAHAHAVSRVEYYEATVADLVAALRECRGLISRHCGDVLPTVVSRQAIDKADAALARATEGE